MTKNRKHGPDPLPPDQLRSKRLSVYVTEDEFSELTRRAELVSMRTPAYLRESGLERLPPTVPEINQIAWLELSKSAANLNQIARHLNQGKLVGVGVILDAVNVFRCNLTKAERKNES